MSYLKFVSSQLVAFAIVTILLVIFPTSYMVDVWLSQLMLIAGSSIGWHFGYVAGEKK